MKMRTYLAFFPFLALPFYSSGDPDHAVRPYVVAYGFGTSMLPTIKPGQALRLYYLPYEELKAGMVVWARDDVQQVDRAHRLLRQTPAGWLIKGDNNPAPDPLLMTKDGHGTAAGRTYRYVSEVVPLENK